MSLNENKNQNYSQMSEIISVGIGFSDQTEKIEAKNENNTPPLLVSKHTPLYILGVSGELPIHQYNDIETLDWMKNNFKSKFDIYEFNSKLTKIKPLSTSFLEELKATKSDFASEQTIDSIHGERHLLRVAIIAFVLSQLYFKDIVNLNDIIISCMYHDVRRVSDKDDKGHGERGGIYFRDKKQKIFSFCTSVECICNSITLHEIDYKLIDKSKMSKSDIIHLQILMASDALDRYRLPRIKWWPNYSRIPLVEAKYLDEFARYLVYETEYNFLIKKMSNFEAIISVCRNLGLVN